MVHPEFAIVHLQPTQEVGFGEARGRIWGKESPLCQVPSWESKEGVVLPFTGTLELANHESLGTTRLMGGFCLLCTYLGPGTQQVLHRGF